jgi:regulator of Ty1 transposition protein 103
MYFLSTHSALSRWCIPHQKRAKDIVETWDKLFNASQKEQRVSFLNLANDILQNSRRKGSEFVNEFWKVLPAALRCVYESGDVHGRKAVNRLVSLIFTCYKFVLSSLMQLV